MESTTANSMNALQDRVISLRNAGNLSEALHAATAAVDQAKKNLNSDFYTALTLAAALEVRGDVQRELGQCDAANEDYRQAIESLQNRPDCFPQIGRIHASSGAAFDQMGNDAQATNHWRKAIEFFERSKPALLLDVAGLSNNLGFTAKATGDLENAENYFLRALDIVNMELGPEHEQTATISSNLASLYQSAGYYEKSREMHMAALETRRKILGESHPDTAQSHNNLALALINTGDRSWARRHFEKALMGFEALGTDYPDDLDAVAANYCNFLHEEGEGYLADVISSRISGIVGSAAVA